MFAVDVFFAVEAEAVVGVEGSGRGVAGNDAEVDAAAVVFGLEAVDEEAHGFFAVAFVLVALVYEEAVHPYSSGGEVFGEEAVHGKAYEESVVVDGYGAPAGTGIGFLQALFDAFYVGFLAGGCFEGEGFFAVGCRDWLEGEVHGVLIPFCLLFVSFVIFLILRSFNSFFLSYAMEPPYSQEGAGRTDKRVDAVTVRQGAELLFYVGGIMVVEL